MAENNNRIPGTVIISVAVVLSTFLFGNAIVRTRTGGNEIVVKGSARKDIDSDFIAWTGKISFRSNNMNDGYTSVKTSVAKLIDYLKSKGLKDNEIMTGAVQTNAL